MLYKAPTGTCASCCSQPWTPLGDVQRECLWYCLVTRLQAGMAVGLSPASLSTSWSSQLAASPSLAVSCGMSTGPQHASTRRHSKAEVAEAFLANIRNRGTQLDLESPGVAEGIRQHFQELPTRYALDVNIHSLDVLNHKRLLDSARADPSAVSFQVRPVDVVVGSQGASSSDRQPSFGNVDSFILEAASQGIPGRGQARRLPRPAFGSSPNLQALVLEAEEKLEHSSERARSLAVYEVTIASVDQPKLLSRLSEALGDLNLNICEAHAFNTTDKYSLDVFVVNGWDGQSEELEEVLSERLQELPPPGARRNGSAHSAEPLETADSGFQFPEDLDLRTRGQPASTSDADDWELDPQEIKFTEKIASGAFGDLYKGAYCGQEVAIKILRDVQNDSQQYHEFLQEVSIMRKVRHKNVVQFIGACTRRPNLCIVVEYMSGGSVYDYMRKAGALKITTILKVATEVCRGMDYLHKRKIVHRDLKAANLLLDETGTVKIADFGVARVMDTAGVMTAETGTYRWMAPEVIEHNPYGEKADVFSFAIVLWELLTGKVPYEGMTPLQAAVGVVQKGLRPIIPPNCPMALAEVMHQCWVRSAAERPSFEALKGRMEELWLLSRQEEAKKPATPGFLSKLRSRGKHGQ